MCVCVRVCMCVCLSVCQSVCTPVCGGRGQFVGNTKGLLQMCDQFVSLSHVTHVLYITLTSACTITVCLYFVIISDGTYEFLDGD